jgi:hypothetical protein
MKRIAILLTIFIAFSTKMNAQATGFCDAVNAILNDAPNDFKNIRGRMMESNINANMWSSTIKVPGTVGYRIVQAMGLFYEGAFIQTSDKDDLQPVYDKYKKQLSECLAPMGYKVSYQENFTAGLSDFKKVVYMKDLKPGLKTSELPPHATIEVTYNKDIGKFTIVMFLFQH